MPTNGEPVVYRDGELSTTPVADDEDVVLIYGRESSDPDDLRISVDNQLLDGVEYATKRWPGVPVLAFRDDDLSAAKKNVVRPGWERMLRELRIRPTGTVVAIWANEQSRLTRLGETSWDDLRVIFNMAGLTEVHTSLQGVIGIEPGNSLAGRLYAVIDSEFAERTRVKVRNTHDKLYQQGRPSRSAPFGYRTVKDEHGRSHYEPDPDEAPIVERMFSWALAGVALSVIVDKLNADGVLPRSAKWKWKDGRKITGWQPNTVRYVLTSPTVAGLRGHTDDDGVLHTTAARWDAIIHENDWRKVQLMLGQARTVVGSDGQSYRVRTIPNATPRRYLLSAERVRGQDKKRGVLRCAKCDSALVAQTQGRRNSVRVPAYACHPNAGGCGRLSISPADQVETHVVAALQKELARNETLRARLQAPTTDDARQLRQQRDAAKARMIEAGQLYGAGTIDRDTFDHMHGAAQQAFETAVTALGALDTELTLPSVDDICNRWDELTLAQQRAAVGALIERIDVAPRKSNSGSGGGFDAARLSEPVWRA